MSSAEKERNLLDVDALITLVIVSKRVKNVA